MAAAGGTGSSALGGRVHLNSATLEQLDDASGHRPDHRAEDSRLPGRAWGVRLRRRAGRGLGHRARHASPNCAISSTCEAAGGAGACPSSPRGFALRRTRAFARVSLLVVPRRRRGARLRGCRHRRASADARPSWPLPSSSPGCGGEACVSTLSITASWTRRSGAPARLSSRSPARRGGAPSRCGCPCGFYGSATRRRDERARLDLPAGRAPPQGALLSVVVEIERPATRGRRLRRGGHTCDGRACTSILTASTFRIVGHRGGLGGLADRVRGVIAASLAPGVSGERRAVIAAVVLGEDEGLSPELRDRFRASGLYHLLAVSGQNVAYVVAGMLAPRLAPGNPTLDRRARRAGCGGRLPHGRRVAAIRGPGRSRGRARVPRLAGRACARPLVLPLRRRGRAARVEPVLASRAGLPALLREPSPRSSSSFPRIEARLAGYPIPRGLATVIAVSAACGGVTAPILMAPLPGRTVLHGRQQRRLRGSSSRRSWGWHSSRLLSTRCCPRPPRRSHG